MPAKAPGKAVMMMNSSFHAGLEGVHHHQEIDENNREEDGGIRKDPRRTSAWC